MASWFGIRCQLGGPISLANFRKDITIDLLNEAWVPVLRYIVHRCCPSEYVAVGPLDANHGAVAIETLVLQNEGWERDTAVVEPKET